MEKFHRSLRDKRQADHVKAMSQPEPVIIDETHIEHSLFRTLAKLERLQEKRLAREVKVDEPMDIEPEPIQPPKANGQEPGILRKS